MLQLIYELRKNCCGWTGRVDGTDRGSIRGPRGSKKLFNQIPFRRNHYKWPHVAQEPQDRPDQDEAKKPPDCFSSTAPPFVKDCDELGSEWLACALGSTKIGMVGRNPIHN